MCKYCENVTTGDRWEPIASIQAKVGFIGNIETCVALVKDMKRRPALYLGLERSGNMTAENEVSQYVPVKYCPMCGRKLEEEQI